MKGSCDLILLYRHWIVRTLVKTHNSAVDMYSIVLRRHFSCHITEESEFLGRRKRNCLSNGTKSVGVGRRTLILGRLHTVLWKPPYQPQVQDRFIVALTLCLRSFGRAKSLFLKFRELRPFLGRLSLCRSFPNTDRQPIIVVVDCSGLPPRAFLGGLLFTSEIFGG